MREAVEAIGFELDGLDIVDAGRRRLVRVVVDSDAGVGLDDVARATRSVSEALDAQDDLVSGAYTLEVTSPGVDRPLTGLRHWRRNRLRLVQVRQKDGVELTGRIGDADEDGVTLLVGGSLRRIAFADVDRAVVEVEFRPVPDADVVALNAADSAGTRPTGSEEER